MVTSAAERRQARREAFAWLSFFIFQLISLFFGSIFAFRILPTLMGIEMERIATGWQMLWIFGGAILVIILLVYVGAISWMLFAKFFFSRAEVVKIAFYGGTTRVDRWMVDLLYPPQR